MPEITMDNDERISRIRERAYQRWITYGGSHPVADWLTAEREIDAEIEKKDVGPTKSTKYLGIHHPDEKDIENPT
jgi:hypothetical protein